MSKNPSLRNSFKDKFCLVCGTSPCDPAHLRSWGASGQDDLNIVPLCRFHHQEQHKLGWLTFIEREPILQSELPEWFLEHLMRRSF